MSTDTFIGKVTASDEHSVTVSGTVEGSGEPWSSTTTTDRAGGNKTTVMVLPRSVGGVLLAQVSVDAAEMRTLFSSPKTLIVNDDPAKTAVLVWYSAQAVGGTADFSGVPDAFPSIYYGSDRTTPVANFSAPRNLDHFNYGGVIAATSSEGFGLALSLTQGQPLVLAGSVDLGIWGEITSIDVTSGQGGIDYAPGDLFGIDPDGNNSSGDAIGIVLTAPGGVVATVAVTGPGTDPGTRYTSGTGIATSVNTGSGDGTLQVDPTVAVAQNGSAELDLLYRLI